jgi:nucleotide-binding universal stress UspA family protein
MIETIFHPSDFSETSQIAFAHSLKFALAFQSELRLLHVSAESHHGRGYDFPSLREILANWKVLPIESHRSSGKQLGIEVDKVVVHSSNVVTAVTNFIAKHPASLIVLAAHRTENQQSWFGHSRAEPIAGEIVMLDRSWYNRTGVERVMKFCRDAEFREFMRQAPEFVRNLVRRGIQVSLMLRP